MNSIKEQSTVNVVAKDAKSYEIGFEAGANDVLECIEEVTNICFDEELRKVIEQLKNV